MSNRVVVKYSGLEIFAYIKLGKRPRIQKYLLSDKTDVVFDQDYNFIVQEKYNKSNPNIMTSLGVLISDIGSCTSNTSPINISKPGYSNWMVLVYYSTRDSWSIYNDAWFHPIILYTSAEDEEALTKKGNIMYNEFIDINVDKMEKDKDIPNLFHYLILDYSFIEYE